MFNKIDVVATVKTMTNDVLYNRAIIDKEVKKVKTIHNLTSGEAAMLTRMVRNQTANSLF